VSGEVGAARVGSAFGMAVGGGGAGAGVVSRFAAAVGVPLVGADDGGSGFLPITMSDGTVGGRSAFGASGFGFSCEIGDCATGGSAGNSGNSTGHGDMETLPPMNSPFRARNTVTNGMFNLRCAEEFSLK